MFDEPAVDEVEDRVRDDLRADHDMGAGIEGPGYAGQRGRPAADHQNAPAGHRHEDAPPGHRTPLPFGAHAVLDLSTRPMIPPPAVQAAVAGPRSPVDTSRHV